MPARAVLCVFLLHPTGWQHLRTDRIPNASLLLRHCQDSRLLNGLNLCPASTVANPPASLPHFGSAVCGLSRGPCTRAPPVLAILPDDPATIFSALHEK